MKFCLHLFLLMLHSKVYPGDFSLTNAKFSFVDDTNQVRSVAPALVPIWKVRLQLENGILRLAILPNEGIETYSEGTVLATSLDVTMYGQYTSASDYFTVRRTNAICKEHC